MSPIVALEPPAGLNLTNTTNPKKTDQITRARGNEEAAKIDSQKDAEARVRRAEIESEAARWAIPPFGALGSHSQLKKILGGTLSCICRVEFKFVLPSSLVNQHSSAKRHYSRCLRSTSGRSFANGRCEWIPPPHSYCSSMSSWVWWNVPTEKVLHRGALQPYNIDNNYECFIRASATVKQAFVLSRQYTLNTPFSPRPMAVNVGRIRGRAGSH